MSEQSAQREWSGTNGRRTTIDRSLRALGFDDVASSQPLIYPGRTVSEPVLLRHDELLPLTVSPEPLGRWQVNGGDTLDNALRRLGQCTTGERYPVLAVGSNASPGQISHKLSRLHIPAVLPMIPAEVHGIGVGISGHISPAGYVAASPYADESIVSKLVVTWFDATQIRAIDDTELPEYRRVLVKGSQFRMTLPSGERLAAAYLYVNVRGVLQDSSGVPRPAQEQRSLLAGLLTASPRLRALLGPDPQTWVKRAGSDPRVREEGTRAFAQEGWVLHQDVLTERVERDGDERLLTFDELQRLPF